ncbi:phosphatidylinositol kinase [Aureococcus anophagefferens]|nr:phosphatidylinositol kinase [Aureococcus anophagefferens]
MASAGALDAALAALHAPAEARAQEEAADGALVYSVCPEQLVKDIEQSIVVEKPEAATIQARSSPARRSASAPSRGHAVRRVRRARAHGAPQAPRRGDPRPRLRPLRRARFATLKAVLEAPNGAAARDAARAPRAAKRGKDPATRPGASSATRASELRQARSRPRRQDTGRTCAGGAREARRAASRTASAPELDPASMDPVAPWRELGAKVLALAIAQLEKSKADRRCRRRVPPRTASTTLLPERAASAGGLAAKALADYATDASAKQFADPAKALRLLRRSGVVAPSALVGARALRFALARGHGAPVGVVEDAAAGEGRQARGRRARAVSSPSRDAREDWAPVVAPWKRQRQRGARVGPRRLARHRGRDEGRGPRAPLRRRPRAGFGRRRRCGFAAGAPRRRRVRRCGRPRGRGRRRAAGTTRVRVDEPAAPRGPRGGAAARRSSTRGGAAPDSRASARGVPLRRRARAAADARSRRRPRRARDVVAALARFARCCATRRRRAQLRPPPARPSSPRPRATPAARAAGRASAATTAASAARPRRSGPTSSAPWSDDAGAAEDLYDAVVGAGLRLLDELDLRYDVRDYGDDAGDDDDDGGDDDAGFARGHALVARNPLDHELLVNLAAFLEVFVGKSDAKRFARWGRGVVGAAFRLSRDYEHVSALYGVGQPGLPDGRQRRAGPRRRCCGSAGPRRFALGGATRARPPHAPTARRALAALAAWRADGADAFRDSGALAAVLPELGHYALAARFVASLGGDARRRGRREAARRGRPRAKGGRADLGPPGALRRRRALGRAPSSCASIRKFCRASASSRKRRLRQTRVLAAEALHGVVLAALGRTVTSARSDDGLDATVYATAWPFVVKLAAHDDAVTRALFRELVFQCCRKLSEYGGVDARRGTVPETTRVAERFVQTLFKALHGEPLAGGGGDAGNLRATAAAALAEYVKYAIKHRNERELADIASRKRARADGGFDAVGFIFTKVAFDVGQRDSAKRRLGAACALCKLIRHVRSHDPLLSRFGLALLKGALLAVRGGRRRRRPAQGRGRGRERRGGAPRAAHRGPRVAQEGRGGLLAPPPDDVLRAAPESLGELADWVFAEGAAHGDSTFRRRCWRTLASIAPLVAGADENRFAGATLRAFVDERLDALGLPRSFAATPSRRCTLRAFLDQGLLDAARILDWADEGRCDAFALAAAAFDDARASSDGETRESSGGTDDARLSSPGDVARKARGGALRLYGRSATGRAWRHRRGPAAAAAAVAANFFAGAGDGDDGAPAALAAAVALGFPRPRKTRATTAARARARAVDATAALDGLGKRLTDTMPLKAEDLDDTPGARRVPEARRRRFEAQHRAVAAAYAACAAPRLLDVVEARLALATRLATARRAPRGRRAPRRRCSIPARRRAVRGLGAAAGDGGGLVGFCLDALARCGALDGGVKPRGTERKRAAAAWFRRAVLDGALRPALRRAAGDAPALLVSPADAPGRLEEAEAHAGDDGRRRVRGPRPPGGRVLLPRRPLRRVGAYDAAAAPFARRGRRVLAVLEAAFDGLDGLSPTDGGAVDADAAAVARACGDGGADAAQAAAALRIRALKGLKRLLEDGRNTKLCGILFCWKADAVWERCLSAANPWRLSVGADFGAAKTRRGAGRADAAAADRDASARAAAADKLRDEAGDRSGLEIRAADAGAEQPRREPGGDAGGEPGRRRRRGLWRDAAFVLNAKDALRPHARHLRGPLARAAAAALCGDREVPGVDHVLRGAAELLVEWRGDVDAAAAGAVATTLAPRVQLATTPRAGAGFDTASNIAVVRSNVALFHRFLVAYGPQLLPTNASFDWAAVEARGVYKAAASVLAFGVEGGSRAFADRVRGEAARLSEARHKGSTNSLYGPFAALVARCCERNDAWLTRSLANKALRCLKDIIRESRGSARQASELLFAIARVPAAEMPDRGTSLLATCPDAGVRALGYEVLMKLHDKCYPAEPGGARAAPAARPRR